MKSITLILSSLLLSACTIISSPGKEFYTDIWSSSRDPVYVLNGTYQGYNLYVVTPKYATNIDEAGVLVDSKKIIYKSLTSQDLLNIMSERRKIVQDKVDKQVAVDKIASQLNLSLIYQSNDFYIYQDNKKQYAFFKDGKQVNKIDVTSEIQAYNDKIKADKEAELARILKAKQDKIDAEKNAVAMAILTKQIAQENAKTRALNANKVWQVQAAPEPYFGGRGMCWIKEIRSGRTNDDGSITFAIAYGCKMGSAGSSGLGDITCGVGLSNYVKSSHYSARCY